MSKRCRQNGKQCRLWSGAIWSESSLFALTCLSENIGWAASWQNQQNGMCAQRRPKSAWASTQSDQSLRCVHEESFGPYLPIKHTVKTDQTGQMPRLIWGFAGRTCHFVGFCHEAAQAYYGLMVSVSNFQSQNWLVSKILWGSKYHGT